MKSFTLKLPAAQYAELKGLATDHDVAVAWVTRKCIEEGLSAIKAGEVQLPLEFKRN